MRVDQRLAVEMLKTITERMKKRADGRQRLRRAEERRKLRSEKRKWLDSPRPSIGIVRDDDFGPRALQRSLKEAFK